MTESSKIRVAIVGAGKMGTHHARALSKLSDIELVGVCDTNVWKAQLAAWQANTVAVRDYKDILGRVDAVIIAVPTPLHYEVGKAFLEAGAHCLIEKPLASSVDEAKELLALSETNELVLQVGHIERFNPAVLEAVKHIRDPRYITVERLGPYDPRMSHIGVVMDLMIHDLDILLTLVGSEVESIEALGANLLSGHEDIANVRVRFKTGCVADLTASRISLTKSRKLRAFQKDSYISLDYGNTALKVYRKKSPTIKSLKDVEYLSPKLSSIDPLRNEQQHFLDCIRHNRKPWPSGERGVEALKLALQISEELERYELSGHAGSRSLIPSWAQDLGKIAKSVGKDILRS
ncbi:MAG: UDP-N-acetyl-D-glucosamine dehydrogenase [Elusimicrobia bacterium CG11_big_fil_rev_8_21_14_0_20_64_6]|nr:MAG: UDP-N-acetyl-D-glucosamine dehydrogenase [Elusimicrobia bacterium CG11_big_fil_rev_8_21_14_0_20_64_6]